MGLGAVAREGRLVLGPEPQGFAAWFPGWQFEAGTRYWLSFGKFQKDLGGDSSSANANVLVSRLSYHSEGNSGEFFTRVDSPQRLFIKGLVGTGSLSSGYMNDEDWAQLEILGVGNQGSWPTSSTSTVAYSNTRSNVQGTIAYATGDIGYNLFEAPDYKFGPFIGYNYYRENKQAYGCVQISNEFSDCVTPIPNTVLAITEDDTWNSLRVGFNGDVMLLPAPALERGCGLHSLHAVQRRRHSLAADRRRQPDLDGNRPRHGRAARRDPDLLFHAGL